MFKSKLISTPLEIVTDAVMKYWGSGHIFVELESVYIAEIGVKLNLSRLAAYVAWIKVAPESTNELSVVWFWTFSQFGR